MWGVEGGVVKTWMLRMWWAWEGDGGGCEAWETRGECRASVDGRLGVVGFVVRAGYVIVDDVNALDLPDVACEGADDGAACEVPEDDGAIV